LSGKEYRSFAHECPEWRRAGQLSLFGMSMMTTRGNFGQNLAKKLLSTVVQKAPHQQVQEADQGDQQKELVVKSVVPLN